LGLVSGALQVGQVLPAQYDVFSRLKQTAARQPEPVRGIMFDLIGNGSTMTTKGVRCVAQSGRRRRNLIGVQ